MAECETSSSKKKITIATTPSSLAVDDETAAECVKEFEEMFKDRYTGNDEEFMKTVSKPAPAPPCVDNFFTRQKRNYYDKSKQSRRGRGNYHRFDRDNYRKRDNYHSHRGQHYDRNQSYRDRRRDNCDNQQSRYHPYHRGNYDDNRNRCDNWY